MFRCLAPLLLASGLMAAPPAFVKEGSGPGILLIHGYGGNRDVWAGVAPALARKHTVVRVDLPGSGGTPGPVLAEGAADFEALAADLAALVKREHLAPCLIVGHSMGGPLAALTVLRDPAAFRGLVLVDSFLGTMPEKAFDPILAGLDTDPKGTLGGFFGRMAAGDAQRDRLVGEAMRVPVPVLQAYLRGMTRNYLKGRQGDLKLPVAQLEAGPEETDLAKRKAMHAMYGFTALPDFRVVAFPKAKHWVMWDDAEGFLEAVAAFERALKRP